MRIFKKFLSVFLAIALCVSALSIPAFAATEWSAGTATVKDGDDDEVYFVMQCSIFYNSFTKTALDIDAMHTRVWNYGLEIKCSYFGAENASRTHSSELFLASLYGLDGGPISTGARNQVTTIDWSVLTDLYNSDTVYSYTSSECCSTQTGVIVEAYPGLLNNYFYYFVYWMPNLTRDTDTYGF